MWATLVLSIVGQILCLVALINFPGHDLSYGWYIPCYIASSLVILPSVFPHSDDAGAVLAVAKSIAFAGFVGNVVATVLWYSYFEVSLVHIIPAFVSTVLSTALDCVQNRATKIQEKARKI